MSDHVFALDIQSFNESPFGNLPTTPWDYQATLPEWVYEKLVPAKSIGMIYGPSNSGKSHFLCSMVDAMLSGQNEWMGRKLKSGPVLMFSESIGHIQARTLAYRELNQSTHVHNFYSFPTMSLNTSTNIVHLEMWLSRLPEPPEMLIFDTFSTSFNIEENDNQQVSTLIKNLEKHILPAISPTGTIILVHHTSKASEGTSARGASALIGNIDWSIVVKWDPEAERTIAQWQKDRWHLVDEAPTWAGVKRRLTVHFTNGQTEITALEWTEWSEEDLEAEKEAKAEAKIEGYKATLMQALQGEQMPVYIHSNSRSKTPAGYEPYRLSGIISDTKVYKILYEWMRDTMTCEPVFNTNGIETGFIVKGL